MLPAATFGSWLKERRQALDLTQTALADQVLCSANLIQKLESGARRPSRQLAELLAQALSIPADEQGAFVAWARGVGGAPPAGAGAALAAGFAWPGTGASGFWAAAGETAASDSAASDVSVVAKVRKRISTPRGVLPRLGDGEGVHAGGSGAGRL